jgi:hypothetical protein
VTRTVTERDFRAPEFYDADPADYEFREDGKIVRKDRWERGIGSIRHIVGVDGREFEISDVVEAVRNLAGVRVREAIEDARHVYADEPAALQCLDYLQSLLNAKQEQKQ